MEQKMNKPDISPHFTTEDIHKIREWNFERRKGMSREEELADIRRGAAEFESFWQISPSHALKRSGTDEMMGAIVLRTPDFSCTGRQAPFALQRLPLAGDKHIIFYELPAFLVGGEMSGGYVLGT